MDKFIESYEEFDGIEDNKYLQISKEDNKQYNKFFKNCLNKAKEGFYVTNNQKEIIIPVIIFYNLM